MFPIPKTNVKTGKQLREYYESEYPFAKQRLVAVTVAGMPDSLTIYRDINEHDWMKNPFDFSKGFIFKAGSNVDTVPFYQDRDSRVNRFSFARYETISYLMHRRRFKKGTMGVPPDTYFEVTVPDNAKIVLYEDYFRASEVVLSKPKKIASDPQFVKHVIDTFPSGYEYTLDWKCQTPELCEYMFKRSERAVIFFEPKFVTPEIISRIQDARIKALVVKKLDTLLKAHVLPEADSDVKTITARVDSDLCISANVELKVSK